MRAPDPAVLVAALLISGLAAAATAARAPSPWWAAVAFVGVAALVIGVHSALSRKSDLDRARELVRQVSAAAGEIRARSLTVPAADTVAASLSAVVESAYRLAYLTAPTPAPLAPTIRRLRAVADRVDGPPSALNALIEELALIGVDLDREIRRR